MTNRRSVELVASQRLSPSVRAMSFRCVDRAPLGHLAGQWLNFDVPVGGTLVRRAYSIASGPTREPRDSFEIAVTRVLEGGSASIALHELELGARLEVDGPHGFFTRENAEQLPALMVATGTGVCPLRAMLQQELAAAEGPGLALLLGCRTEAEILWREEFEALARAHPRFAFHVTLSRPDASWRGLRGHVQAHIEPLLAGQRPHVYVCGLTRMISEVRVLLKERLGYDRKLIHSERYD